MERRHTVPSRQEEGGPYRKAGIDIQNYDKRLAVVVADVSIFDEYKFERRRVWKPLRQLRLLAEALNEEAVMESTNILETGMGEALERY